MFEATNASLAAHKVPQWFDDAKFGIFIHWSLFSVPAYAPETEGDIMEEFKTKGMAALKESPYAEWYMNSMQFKDCRTWKHHVATYGEDFDYRQFKPMFEKEAAKMDPKVWADLFKEAGAKYVVLVTKHHDGYCLWPTSQVNPNREHWYSDRDFVGELTDAVRADGMKMGLYYSGVFDWTFTHEPICSMYSMLASQYHDQEYIDYCDSQVYELIDRYHPSVLWNDIGYPYGTDIRKIFAYYYNNVPEGVINDRWRQTPVPAPGTPEREAFKNTLEGHHMEFNGEGMKPDDVHCDFTTPEYNSLDAATDYKWESCRGIGKSFGYCANETVNDILTYEELTTFFADVVSKNGNVLLNVGPRPDGSIQEEHVELLKRFGKFLEINGEAFYGTRPWTQAEAKTCCDTASIRFTQKEGKLYISLLGKPAGCRFAIKGVKLPNNKLVALDGGAEVPFEICGDDTVLQLSAVPTEPVTCFAIDL